MSDTGYRWKWLNEQNCWTWAFTPVTFFGTVVSAIEGKIFKMLGIVNLAAWQKGRIWVCMVFRVAGLENVRLYVILVTKFGTPIECMYLQHFG
jgi:hypothetical protein